MGAGDARSAAATPISTGWPAAWPTRRAAWACPVVGGDLTAADQVVVSVSVVGLLDGPRPAVTRSGAVGGDTLVVTGPLGASAAGLRLLRAGVSERAARRRPPAPTRPPGGRSGRPGGRRHGHDRRLRRLLARPPPVGRRVRRRLRPRRPAGGRGRDHRRRARGRGGLRADHRHRRPRRARRGPGGRRPTGAARPRPLRRRPDRPAARAATICPGWAGSTRSTDRRGWRRPAPSGERVRRATARAWRPASGAVASSPCRPGGTTCTRAAASATR